MKSKAGLLIQLKIIVGSSQMKNQYIKIITQIIIVKINIKIIAILIIWEFIVTKINILRIKRQLWQKIAKN